MLENLPIDGASYRRSIEENGKPLTSEKAHKELRRFEKELARHQAENAEKRRKRIENEEKERAEEIKFRRELPQAYDFRLTGEELANGQECWRISAEPKAGFKPKTRLGSLYAKLHGEVWSERADTSGCV